MLNHIINNFLKHEFHDVLAGNQIFLCFMVNELSQYDTGIEL